MSISVFGLNQHFLSNGYVQETIYFFDDGVRKCLANNNISTINIFPKMTHSAIPYLEQTSIEEGDYFSFKNGKVDIRYSSFKRPDDQEEEDFIFFYNEEEEEGEEEEKENEGEEDDSEEEKENEYEVLGLNFENYEKTFVEETFVE